MSNLEDESFSCLDVQIAAFEKIGIALDGMDMFSVLSCMFAMLHKSFIQSYKASEMKDKDMFMDNVDKAFDFAKIKIGDSLDKIEGIEE